MLVNCKRVARLMGEDNLIAFGQRQYGVATTDSQHDFEVYLNLASRMKVTAVNQLWVADITYIRLQREFVFLAVILDAYSRRVVGRGLARSLHSELAQRALKAAMELRRPQPGLVHHSDRGIQYACREYTALLEAHGLIPSMSRPGNPYDNASCESFMKTLKREEVYCRDYQDYDDLSQHLEAFIEQYYNRQRLHSALSYRAPADFEAAASGAGETGAMTAAPRMTFFQPGGDRCLRARCSQRNPDPFGVPMLGGRKGLKTAQSHQHAASFRSHGRLGRGLAIPVPPRG